MKKYNLSKIMKRAWELVKKAGMTISEGLRKAWAEAKASAENLVDKLVENLNDMAYNDYHIRAGVEREAVSKVWEKNGMKRAYLTIVCRSLTGNFKGSYKAGYVDLITNAYFCGKYDEIDAEKMEYIGR